MRPRLASATLISAVALLAGGASAHEVAATRDARVTLGIVERAAYENRRHADALMQLAWLPHGILSACPFPATAAVDGCLGAPVNGSFKSATLLTDYAKSGQSYSSLPQFNVPGRDYRNGYDTASPLQDPRTMTLPASCWIADENSSPTVSSATGGRRTIGKTLICGGNARPAGVATTFSGGTIDHADFSLNNCTFVYLGGTNTVGATLTITNSKFAPGTNCAPATDGGAIKGQLLAVISGSTANVDIENFEIDGTQYESTSYPYSINAFALGANGTSAAAPCATTVKYGYVHNIPGNFATIDTRFCKTFVKYNVEADFNYSANSHGAFIAGNPGAGTLATPGEVNEFDQSYNFLAYTINSPGNGGTTAFSLLGNPGNFSQFDLVNVDHNVVVTNPYNGKNYAYTITGISGSGTSWTINYTPADALPVGTALVITGASPSTCNSTTGTNTPVITGGSPGSVTAVTQQALTCSYTSGGAFGGTTASGVVNILRTYIVNAFNVVGNFIDPTGILNYSASPAAIGAQCFSNHGDGQNANGFIDDGSGGGSYAGSGHPGAILTLTSSSFGFYPGASFGNGTGDVVYGYIAPYGSLSTTGVSSNGTYALCKSADCHDGYVSTAVSFSNWVTLTANVTTPTFSSNVSLNTGVTEAPGSSPQWAPTVAGDGYCK